MASRAGLFTQCSGGFDSPKITHMVRKLSACNETRQIQATALIRVGTEAHRARFSLLGRERKEPEHSQGTRLQREAPSKLGFLIYMQEETHRSTD